MTGKADFLIGKILFKSGSITRQQLNDSLLAQERNPEKTLGEILVQRGYLNQKDLETALQLQKRAIEARDDGTIPRGGTLLGRLLVERGLATQYQVNECLRLQGQLDQIGMKPPPLLGEILMREAYLNKEALETALQLQLLHLYGCPDCGEPVDVARVANLHEDYTCGKCKASIPSLFAKMAASIQEALVEVSHRLVIELPDEVRGAMLDPTNHFGRYIFIKQIGRGGAGIVFRVWQKDVNKVVALKLLPHQSDMGIGVRTPFGDADDVKRFFNETRAVADLIHPNIVPILDFGNVQNHFFYTMRFIEGVTLDSALHEGIDGELFQTTIMKEVDKCRKEETAPVPGGLRGKSLPPARVAEIIRDIARAVDFAHRRGIYHRDIKPANIMIDNGGHPWIMDFGLARVKHMGDRSYPKGVIMGTPYYMPPEQALGDMEKVDQLSDVYSLGAVMYEMASGHVPYSDKSPQDVLSALAKEPPVPVRVHAPGIPIELERIIKKAMRRERKSRYQGAGALAADLEFFLGI